MGCNYLFSALDTWLWHIRNRYQSSRAVTSNYIPHILWYRRNCVTVGYNYLSLPLIPASGTYILKSWSNIIWLFIPHDIDEWEDGSHYELTKDRPPYSFVEKNICRILRVHFSLFSFQDYVIHNGFCICDSIQMANKHFDTQDSAHLIVGKLCIHNKTIVSNCTKFMP